jgi:hypothetical protein
MEAKAACKRATPFDVFVVLKQSHESDAYVIEEFSATSAVDDVAERGRNIKTIGTSWR